MVEKADVVRDGWNGFNVLHDTASRVAALDIGFQPSARARASSSERLASRCRACEVVCCLYAALGWLQCGVTSWALAERCLLPFTNTTTCPPLSPAAAPKLVYLLGADDFSEADVPADAFVIYQVGGEASSAVGMVLGTVGWHGEPVLHGNPGS